MERCASRRWAQCGAKRVAAALGFLTAMTGLVGCAGPTFVVQQYAGPLRPKEDVAILRLSGGNAPQLVALDGEELPPILDARARMHIEMLPGTHELQTTAPHRGVFEAVSLYLAAEPGKVYRIEVRPAEADRGLPGIAYAYEVDRRSDAPLGAALVPPAPPDRAGRGSAPATASPPPAGKTP